MKTSKEILKLNYITQQLENGFSKRKETMVLSSFCFDHRLEDIEPIFQHEVVDHKNKNVYFFDLYYPGVNIFIEVDEEHHETKSSKKRDEAKEHFAREELKTDLFKIRFHHNHENLCKQIEEAKLAILAKKNKYIWEPRQFNAEDAIQTHQRTILVSVSRHNKNSILNIPLQLTNEIIQVSDLNIVYMTGKSGTVTDAFLTQPHHWSMENGNSRHTGVPNPANSLLQSGSTLYNKYESILYSPDIKPLAFKNKRKKK